VKIQLLQDYLERSALRYPRNTAIVSAERAITYRELWRQSGELAARLIGMGFEPGNTVGIYLPKSVEAIIALFAVLRAGGVYIPLDTHYAPPSRTGLILAASRTHWVISASPQWNDFITDYPEYGRRLSGEMTVIFIDSTSDDTGPPLPGSRPVAGTGDLAYILYTSGSTGVPKGVMITHENALTFINWALELFKPGENDAFSNMALLHFDLSVFDLYVSLACGACLYLVPHHVGMNPRGLLDWIRKNRITYFYSVPSVWVSILNHTGIEKGDLPHLSHILFAGEMFPPRELKSLMESVSHAAYYNLYGPTETNVCTWYRVEGRTVSDDRPVPIGRACKGTEVIVLKDDNTEASPGETGELLVHGPGVTPGYYNNPESTGEVFLPSPLAGHRGRYFYRTGDIVRVLPSGILEFVGRKDLMIKCAGFRVELEEVERALLRHKAVKEAVAVPLYADDHTAASAVAAFIASKHDIPPGVIELKEFLGGIVPRYMIPDSIRFVDEIPKNINGKADRRLLTEQANRVKVEKE